MKESLWWKDVKVASCDAEGDWFGLGVQKFVKGNDTSFWLDDWIGTGKLCDKFHRLYNLSKLKYHSINNCGEWDQGVWCWKLRWRRPLVGRELQWLAMMLDEAKRVPLSKGVPDKWCWLPSNDGIFTVNSFYSLLQAPVLLPPDPIFIRIWKSVAPSNIKAFAWRVMLDRIPCLQNLWKRKVIRSQEEAISQVCCSDVESCEHLLFSCPVSLDIWRHCYRWMGVCTALPRNAREHLLQFQFGGDKKQQRGANAICGSVELMGKHHVFVVAKGIMVLSSGFMFFVFLVVVVMENVRFDFNAKRGGFIMSV
ncbi:uncharacterized protein LOC130724152 [Lotus japonicus]|uniref:uncharacterized protein LOC130724152 n=1 Tax=Lotus japonicus TaxID=34305 RepID=UPI00258F0A38|nr:uncharacterized protein LOC130724152 [Lotus japonicus]